MGGEPGETVLVVLVISVTRDVLGLVPSKENHTQIFFTLPKVHVDFGMNERLPFSLGRVRCFTSVSMPLLLPTSTKCGACWGGFIAVVVTWVVCGVGDNDRGLWNPELF